MTLRQPAHTGTTSPEVQIGSQRWQPVATLRGAGPEAHVYVMVAGSDGSAHLVFGDGIEGRRPPTGTPISVSYRTGAGAGGNAVITPPPASQNAQGFTIEIVPATGGLHVRHTRHRHR